MANRDYVTASEYYLSEIKAVVQNNAFFGKNYIIKAMQQR